MTQRRLIVSLLLFFVALALPSSILVYQAYGQLKWEAFHQHQQLARELTLRIDSGFRELIAREERRPISDYEFFNVAGSDGSAFLQRSPLSEFPLKSEIPGLLGYFQVDASGQLHTPLVPAAEASNSGINPAELTQRRLQEARIRGILERNRLVGENETYRAADLDEALSGAPAENTRDDSPMSLYQLDSAAPVESSGESDREVQSAFDELSSGRIETAEQNRAPREQLKDLKLEDSYDVAGGAALEAESAAEPKRQIAEKRSRKEKVNLPQSAAEEALALEKRLSRGAAAGPGDARVRQLPIRIKTFESEVEPMEFALLDDGHFVLFRRVWHDGERKVQGLLLDRKKFIERQVAPAFRESSLASMSRLIVAYRGDILQSFEPLSRRDYRPGVEQQGNELLYQSRLVAPFGDIELVYTLARLPIGAGGQVIIWSALVLALVLTVGCFMLWRLGRRQLALARQQQDFVSAVSHELKTPLTSIRMYGEMLREGWADEQKRKSYYDFIFHEAERLTRLINNVLQLARLSRNEQPASLAATTVGSVIDELRPRLESQLEAAGFELAIDVEPAAAAAKIDIDTDGFLQIFINLVDNAAKFSAAARQKRIDIACRRLRDGRVQFSVRDYGPGIAPDQLKKIFTLFYRSENELTRETVGTGIGLALVRQLADSMRAEIDVVNSDPGAEFRIRFPATG